MTPATRTHDVAVIQTTIPDYRTTFFEALSHAVGPGLLLLSGDEDWYRDLRHAGRVPHVRTRNVFFARRRLLWQRGAVRPLLAARVAVVGLNPRIVTNWVVLIARRLMGRRTIVWGHAWSRRGSTSPTDRLRGAMRRLGSTVIVYTETEARQVRTASPKLDVVAAPNALYPRAELLRPLESESADDFVFVGRLTPSKKPTPPARRISHRAPEAATRCGPRLRRRRSRARRARGTGSPRPRRLSALRRTRVRGRGTSGTSTPVRLRLSPPARPACRSSRASASAYR